MAVHVFPRARSGFPRGIGKTRTKTESRLLVLVLVERLLRSAEKGRKRPNGTNGKQQQPRHLPARSLVSTFWKARFCDVWAFFVATASLAVPSAENVIKSLFGSGCCGLRNALVPGLRVRTAPSAIGPIKGGKNTQPVRHVSIVSAPSGTTVIELQIIGTLESSNIRGRIIARDLARAQQPVAPRAGVEVLRRGRRRATDPLVRVEASARQRDAVDRHLVFVSQIVDDALEVGEADIQGAGQTASQRCRKVGPEPDGPPCRW